MTGRTYTFGAGTLYVGDKPYAVTGVDISFETDPVPTKVAPDWGTVEVNLDGPSTARVSEAFRRYQAMAEAELRRMLGEWVSGLEPCILLDDHGHMVGLTIAGVPEGVRAPVVVRARPITFELI